jgi:WD40 repeat protein
MGDIVERSRSTNYLRILDLNSHRVKDLIPDLEGAVTCLSPSNDGTQIAVAVKSSSGTSVMIVEPESHRSDRLFTLPADVTGLAYGPTSTCLAIGASDGSLRLYDVKSKRNIWSKHEDSVSSLSWNSTTNRIAEGTETGHVNLREADTGKVVSEWQQPDAVTKIAFSGDGTKLATGSGEHQEKNDQVVRCFSIVRPIEPPVVFSLHRATITALAFEPDGARIASGDASGKVLVWNCSDGSLYRSLSGSARPVFSVGWRRVGDSDEVGWGGSTEGDRDPSHFVGAAFPQAAAILPSPSQGGWSQEIARLDGLSCGVDHGEAYIDRDGRRVKIPLEPGDVAKDITFLDRDRIAIASAFALAIWSVGDVPKRLFTLAGHQGLALAVAPNPLNPNYLASGSSDGTVCIWDLKQRPRSVGIVRNAIEPALTMFYGTDGRWIMWEPSGVYSASPTGDEVVTWVTESSVETLPKVYSAFQFRKRFNRPDRIQSVVSSGGAPPAPDSNVRITDLIVAAPPPELTCDQPIAKGETIHVTVKADSGSTVTVALLDNRKPVVHVVVEIDAKGEADVAVPIAGTFPGHDLKITAENASGTAKGAVEATQPWDPHSVLQNLHFVAAGVGDYKNVPPLRYATNDAIELTNFFHSRPGCQTLPPLLDQRVSAKSIEDRVKTIDRLVKPNDMAIFFLSGHGVQVDEKDSSTFYFATPGVKAFKTAARTRDEDFGIEYGAFLNSIATIPCRYVMLILDTCHAGELEDDLGRAKKIRVAAGVTRIASDAGIITLCASGSGLSYEFDSLKHGLFTYYLLDSLKGHGWEKSLSVRSLYDLTTASIEAFKAAKDVALDQTPDLGHAILTESQLANVIVIRN